MYWAITWFLSLTVFCYSVIMTSYLRNWVAYPEWLTPSPSGEHIEDDIRGFGQTVAVVAMAAVVISMLDVAANRRKG